MILYDSGDYHFQFVWHLRGSLLPRAMACSLFSAAMTVGWWYALDYYPEYLEFLEDMQISTAWSILTLVLGMLISFRTSVAYGRFWEGVTLVQIMRAEWFTASSNVMAFSKFSILQNPDDERLQEAVLNFQSVLVRLMSFLHGAALRQIGGNAEEFEVIDINGLDAHSLRYLATSADRGSIVELCLHWIGVLITDSVANGAVSIPAPLLTRVYQTLSRGHVNLTDAKKLAETPFPFPLAQISIVLLWLHMIFTPLAAVVVVQNIVFATLLTVVPISSYWCLIYVAGQNEQPFGSEVNDLPLSTMQFEFNTSLLMLLDPESIRAPVLKETAAKDVWELRACLGDEGSTTCLQTMKRKSLAAVNLNERVNSDDGAVSRLKRIGTRQFSPDDSDTLKKTMSSGTALAKRRWGLAQQVLQEAQENRESKVERQSSMGSNTESKDEVYLPQVPAKEEPTRFGGMFARSAQAKTRWKLALDALQQEAQAHKQERIQAMTQGGTGDAPSKNEEGHRASKRISSYQAEMIRQMSSTSSKEEKGFRQISSSDPNLIPPLPRVAAAMHQESPSEQVVGSSAAASKLNIYLSPPGFAQQEGESMPQLCQTSCVVPFEVHIHSQHYPLSNGLSLDTPHAEQYEVPQPPSTGKASKIKMKGQGMSCSGYQGHAPGQQPGALI